MNYFLANSSMIQHRKHLIMLLGRFIGGMLPMRNPGGLFFFFPFSHIGGAEKVHSDIVNCFAEKKPWVFFTKWSSRPDLLRSKFDRAARVFNWTIRLKYSYPLSAGIMAGMINRHPNAVVFGCNTLFFYKMLPYLDQHVRKVDLLHAFGGGAEKFSLPVVSFLDARVVINQKTADDLKKQYSNNTIDQKLLERVTLIENCVEIPPAVTRKTDHDELKILYVGRASKEKRVHLIGEIAALVAERGIPASFTLVGDIPVSTIRETSRKSCRFAGEISDQSSLNRLYAEADILLITSSREGFPLVIMEAMAHGVIPVATAVGGIPLHISNEKNGWLVDNHKDERLIAESFCTIIAKAAAERSLLKRMSESAYLHAAKNFSSDNFCKSYHRLLIVDGDNGNA